MRLFQFAYSPFAAKVRVCLALKKLEATLVEVPYMDRRELVALTPGSVMIPVIEDGGTVVSDSARITAYLDERYAPSLRAGALEGAATVYEAWADNVLEDVAFRLASTGIDEKITAHNGGREEVRAMFRVNKERKFGPGCIEAWKKAEFDLETRLRNLLAPLGKTLAEQPFLLGQKPTLADAAVYGQFAMLEWAHPGRMASIAPGMRDWDARMVELAGAMA